MTLTDIRKCFSHFNEHQCTTLAASLAYYTALALPPLLYLLVMVITAGLTFVFDDQQSEIRARELIEHQAGQLLGNQAASDEIGVILQQTRNSSGQWWKTSISLIGVLIAASGLIGALQDSLNRVWRVKPDPSKTWLASLFLQRIFSLAMVVAVGFLLLVSLILSTILTIIGERVAGKLEVEALVASSINYFIQVLLMLVIFMGIFKWMPSARIRWRDVLVGTVLTTTLFFVGQVAMGFYFSHFEAAAALGSAATSLAVILIWVYYNAIIVLFGAVVTQVYVESQGMTVVAADGAVRVVEIVAD